MKSVNKLFLGLATATAILAPLVPKSVNINVNLSAEAPAVTKAPKRTQVVVETKCDLVSKTVRDGKQDCEYMCRGSQTTIHKAYYSSNGICYSPITEKILVTEKR